VDAGRPILLEVEDRTPAVRHELLARLREEPAHMHARVLRRMELGDVVGAECEEVDALTAFEVDDAKPLPGGDLGPSAPAGRHLDTRCHAHDAAAALAGVVRRT
jgi:hypothetical protein